MRIVNSVRRRVAVVLLAALALAGTAPSAAEERITAMAVGHEYRQDDLPAIAAAADGSIWVAWLSFVGDRDDLGVRRWLDGKWGNLQWVPGTSGDCWLPQLGVDASNRVWVVWSQMAENNWDLYARSYDPATHEWGRLERLTDHPLPDINPRMASDGNGKLVLVWQGFRGRNSNIFLRTFDGSRWSGEVRVTNRPANDWEPAVAIDSQGNAWVAYDSYKDGDYDVFLRRVADGTVQGEEIAVAATPRFEARATVTVDSANRVWVAWEAGRPNWGKDQGYVIRDRPSGAPLGSWREPRIRCFDNGRWREPAQPLAEAFAGKHNTYQPHVFSDGRGSVWVVAKTRLVGPPRESGGRRGYFEYWATRYEANRWAPAFALPQSKGRSSTRVNAALARDGALWLAWATDNRREGYYHRPIRQEVLAGRIDAPPRAEPQWGSPAEERVEVAKGHDDEPGDLRAIRAYTAEVSGRKLRIVRGDFHRHTELSWDGGGGNDGSLQDFYRYMIDAGAMDFGASTDHQGGAWPYWWWYTQKMADMHHVPGAYVPLFGYERSVIYPNGHRNVFFANRSQSRVTPFHMKAGVEPYGLPPGAEGDEPGVGTGDVAENDTKLLYDEIRRRGGLAIPHTSGTRMGTDWRDNDPELEPVVEIFQGCRTSYEKLGAPLVADVEADKAHIERAGYRPEGMVSNAWAKGYKLGIIASSDHGSTHISYAMVYTDDFSRQGILDAIRKRHTYGATDNIILDVRMGEHFMGDEFGLEEALPLRVKVVGPRKIVKVDIIKDNEIIYSTAPGRREVDFEFTDTSGVGGRHFYYVRAQQEDRMIAWSSPMFINYSR